ncbi:MAG: DNA repair exonuclease [Clostridia bacterium]|nr:DNA repair exonuclease [Clostridia bacterium]
MKFLHMADCHLDSAMEAHLPAKAAQKRRGELRLTFYETLCRIEEEHIDAVLLAGDIFDTPSPSKETVKYVLDCLAQHKDTPFIIIEGNHDKGAWAKEDMPSNVRLATGETFESFVFGECAIHALSYPYSPHSFDNIPYQSDKKNVYLLHGTFVSSYQDEASIPISAFSAIKPDYVALGHYHSYTHTVLSDTLSYCYAGTPEGRGFDETGACGVILWDSESGKHTFIPTARRTLHTVSLSIDGLQSQIELEGAILNATADIPERDMVRLVLTGHFSEHMYLQKNIAQVKTLLDDRFYFARVKDESSLFISYEDYRHDVSLKGEFVRLVLGSSLPQTEKEQILLYGLRAMKGEMPDQE